jgi:hypothetical protein
LNRSYRGPCTLQVRTLYYLLIPSWLTGSLISSTPISLKLCPSSANSPMVVRLSFRTAHLVPFWLPQSWYLTRALGALPTLPSVDAGITKPDTGFGPVARAVRQHSLVHLNLIDGVLVHPLPILLTQRVGHTSNQYPKAKGMKT